MKVWRDDDVAVDTTGLRLRQLLEVDDIFQRYGIPHTVAVIVADIWRNGPVIDAVLSRGMIPQLHGWTHDDLVACPDAVVMLPEAARIMADLFGQRPTVLYPPWNHSNAYVEKAAQLAGLEVDLVKVSLDQYVRVMGFIAERTINFHFWAPADRWRLSTALQVAAVRYAMKVTDYAPRAAPFDTYLIRGVNLVGAEIGVDVGAHAEALLCYCPVANLTLIDPWVKDYAFGYCEGRLTRFRHRITMVRKTSREAVKLFPAGGFDFLYFDHVQDGVSVEYDLKNWWPLLKVGGILGHRNYAPVNAGLKEAVDTFVARLGDKVEKHDEVAEAILIKLK